MKLPPFHKPEAKFAYIVSEKNKIINPYAIRKEFKPQKRQQKKAFCFDQSRSHASIAYSLLKKFSLLLMYLKIKKVT